MTNRSSDTPQDWRRQRRGGSGRSPVSEQPAPEPQQEGGAETEEEVVASRTLFSYLEPGLNLLGAFGAPIVFAGIVAIVVGLVLVAFVGDLRNPYGYILLGLGIGMLLLMGLIFLSSVFAAFISRTGRYGVNSLIMLSAFVGIIAVANFIGFQNHARIDVTATQQFSLANDTRELLNNLDQPIRAVAFFREEPGANQERIIRRAKVQETLQEFRSRSRNFSYEFVDPDLNPEVARSYGITRYESIAVEGMESEVTNIVQPTDPAYSELEQDLYTSMLVATGKERKAIYFLTGHGERQINTANVQGETNAQGYDLAREGLERDNYRVETLRWPSGESDVAVPDDAALLVIAGPTGELPEAHADALNSYLQGRNPDGSERREPARLVFLAELGLTDSFRGLLAQWGMVIDQGYIRDMDRSVPGSPQTLRLESYNQSALQQLFPQREPLGVTFMPGASPIRFIGDGQGARRPVPLVGTSPNSYLINDIERTEPVTDAGDESDPQAVYSPAVFMEAIGPVGTPAPSSEPPSNRIARMVVFGDSDFVSNSFFNRGSGADLFLNSANFLVGDFSLVSLRDRPSNFREFPLDQNQYNFVRFSSWLLLPGLMGLLAGLVWWIRR